MARTGTIRGRTRRWLALLSFLVTGACRISGPPDATPEVSDGRIVMGTALELTLQVDDASRGADLMAALFAEASRLEGLLSRHDPASEISRLNQRAGQGAVPVSSPVGELVGLARDEALRTRGAFDPTVGPLVALWTDAARRDRLPSAEDIDEARARVGPGRLWRAGEKVSLDSGSSLDLGGIAKGFALDRMARRLRAESVDAALLSFGQSSVWALGAPAGAPGWRLLVRAPDVGVGGIVTLRDQALSVSGSLGQGSTIQGQRFGHVIDPRTGWPLRERRQAVVICGDATQAEALSTALLVLGGGEGIRLVEERSGCEGLLLDAEGGHFETSNFTRAARFQSVVR